MGGKNQRRELWEKKAPRTLEPDAVSNWIQPPTEVGGGEAPRRETLRKQKKQQQQQKKCEWLKSEDLFYQIYPQQTY